MSKDKNYPAYKWHPQTGDAKIFESASEVPEGWLDTHPANLKNVTTDAPKSDELPMSRDEIKDALKAGNIEFVSNAKTPALYALLVENLQSHLKDAGVEFPENATAPELLALVPKQS